MARVLIIDDDDMVRRLLKEHLSNEGFEVIGSPTADEGLNSALQCPPDLILLDVNLPDATGFQMCGWLRDSPITQSIPIIMMTGAARWPNQQEIGKRMGANAYVLKPFNVIELGDRVHSLVGTKSPVKPELPKVISPLLLKAPVPKPVEPERVYEKVIPLPPARSSSLAEGDQCFSDFSVDVVILVSRLPKTPAGRHIADQLLKCGTAVGARIHASGLAESVEENHLLRRAAIKDLRESAYWLMLIRKSGLLETPSVEKLEKTSKELSAELSAQILPRQQILF